MTGALTFRGTRRPASKVKRLRLLIITIMLFQALFTSVAPSALAQEKPCPEGEMLDVASGQCVVAVPTEDATGVPPEPEPIGSMTIKSYICDSDFDASAASTSDYINSCGFPAEGISYSVYEPSGPGAGGSTSASGYVGFEGLTLETVSVSQAVPAGYSTPFVACAAGDGNTDYVAMPVYGGSSIDLDLAASEYYVCLWFNVAQVAGDITIGITSWDCPNGFVSTIGDQNEFFDNCQVNKLPGVVFNIIGSDGTNAGSGTTDGNGKLAFDKLFPDTYTIAETFPSGYVSSAAFCTYSDTTGTGDFFFETETVTDGAFQHLMKAQDTLICDVYSIQTATPTGITITKYVCDSAATSLPGVNSMSATELQATCLTDPAPYNFEFQISDTLGAAEYEIVGAVIPGGVRFDAYEPGQVTIYETFPAGFAPPLVYCGVVPPGADQPVGLNPIKVLGSFIVLDAPTGNEIQCQWFNFRTVTADGTSLDPNKPVLGLDPIGAPGSSDTLDPNETVPSLDTGTSDTLDPSADVPAVFPTIPPVPTQPITVKFRNCPVTFDPAGKVIGDFWATCKEFPASNEITLTLPDGTIQLDSWPGDTAVFDNPPVGELTFNTGLPAGFTSVYIGCNTTSFIQADLPMVELVSSPPDNVTHTFTYDLDQNRITDCQIFNVRFGAAAAPAEEVAAGFAAEAGALDVYTWTCPVNYDADAAAQNDLIADCTTVMSNISISVATDGGDVTTGLTGVDGPGLASFEGISGDVTVTETLPSGYGTPVVYCGTAPGEAVEIPIAGNSGFALTVIEPEHWTCDVFNTRVAP